MILYLCNLCVSTGACMCVFVCVYVYMCPCICVCLCVCVCVCVYLSVCMSVCLYVCMCVHSDPRTGGHRGTSRRGRSLLRAGLWPSYATSLSARHTDQRRSTQSYSVSREASSRIRARFQYAAQFGCVHSVGKTQLCHSQC
jgi:hypothetical protein